MQRSAASETPRTQAEIYDELFVPALFGQWGPVVSTAAGVGRGDRVLDVACGTGALAEAAAGLGAKTTGLDPNPEMLAVARRKPGIDWIEGHAEALPFAAETFDAVVSQFGMMFFDDRPAALREMARVLKPGGRLAVAVCDALERSPGYAAFAALLRRLFGAAVADAFAAPFTLGDPPLLRDICDAAGLPDAAIDRKDGEVRFDSIAAMVSIERACVWTLGGLLNDAQFARLRDAAETELGAFRKADGQIVFTMPALIISTTKPAA